ncbi:D-alanyl-D-alanine carboxypeptidase family protein [Bacillus litorisediminis]|uniref:D-alanyl-D-alanine carboxypeptidase family protein n=1 Tax=Bacillus litorisediminis TaxID=2922713 RepID=UPI001FAEEF24|nr:D-alanyl-D-alanine carboxypeptidase family protein [Bacillus litorisediminis]
MKRASKITMIFALVWMTLFTSIFGVQHTAQAATDPLGLTAEAAILIDGETGKILYEKNADTALGVASMSKMLTEYIVLEAIHDGKISWEQEVIIDPYIHELSAAPGLSNIGLTQGEAYTVEELYQAMAIHSANAATVALAQLISGSETNFVKLMNEKAAELGLENYKFVNSTGLNNSSLLGKHPQGTDANAENIMSARDTARLAYRLINDYPEVLETASIPRLSFRDGREYTNFNWMLPGLIYEYEGMDGLKTGSTDFAGYCITGTAERDGRRFISVIMKTEEREARFSETETLLNYGFSNFNTVELLKEGYQEKGKESIKVEKGKEDSVKIAAETSISAMIRNGEEELYKPKLVLEKKSLTAPVKKGEVVGYVTLEYTGEGSTGFITNEGKQSIQVPVVTTAEVEKANWFVLMLRGIGDFFSGLFGSIVDTISGWFS